MKKFFALFCLMLSLAVNSYGQGNIVYGNFDGGSLYAPVFNVDGTTPLAGSGFSAQLYFGATGAADNALTALSGTLVNFSSAGIINTLATIQIPGFAAGTTVRLQLRAWDNAGGSITSFESALIRGSSASFISAPLAADLAPNTPYMTGLTSFQLAAVPEPTTIALGVLGGLGLLARRRRNA